MRRTDRHEPQDWKYTPPPARQEPESTGWVPLAIIAIVVCLACMGVARFAYTFFR